MAGAAHRPQPQRWLTAAKADGRHRALIGVPQVLDAAGAATDVPIGAGLALPLVEESQHCPEIHGEDSLGDLRPPLSRYGAGPGFKAWLPCVV